MKCLGLAIVIAASLTSANAAPAPVKNMPPGLQKAADCMYGVVKNEPGFGQAKLGTFENEGLVLPYVQYLAPTDRRGGRITVSFAAEAPCAAVHRGYNCCPENNYCFWTRLGGLFATTEPGPPDGGTGVLIPKWKARCGVDANALFV
jgi:hypothetical protein